VGEAAVHQFRLVEAAAHRLARGRVMGREVLSSWSALMAYCKARMAHRATEEFRVLFLDRKNALIADEVHGRGTVDAVPVYAREVVKRALELNASAVIMVHNHPSGDPTPSPADIAMTRRAKEALAAVDIRLHDHVVIGRQADASFAALGLL
jgi:DNA repair protein RadC